jgi:hypothetical protein
MPLPDTSVLQTDTLWLALVAAGFLLASALLGMFSLVTGRDHLPKQLRWLRRKTPASPDDYRRHGTSMLLTAGAMLIVLVGVSMTTLGAQNHSLGEPANTLAFLLSLVGALTALVLVFASYRVTLSVRYTIGKIPAGAPPVEPSA